MRIEHLLQHYGNQANAADAIQISRQLMSKLKREQAERDKPIPIEYQIKWEVQSHGAVKADVPEQIRQSA